MRRALFLQLPAPEIQGKSPDNGAADAQGIDSMLRIEQRFLGALMASLVVVPALSAQVRPTQPTNASSSMNTGRMQGTRDMHVACVGRDSGSTYRRGIGDSLSVNNRMPMMADSTRRSGMMGMGDSTRQVTGGTARSHEYPEYDVVLDIPNVCVERIFLKVDSLTARLSLNAAVANLVRVNAGADVLIGNVDLTIQDVRARALLLVDLDDVVHIVDQTLTFVDNNPQIITQLGGTLQNTVGAVGGLVNQLLVATTKLVNGNTVQRLVDQASGSILEKTLGTAGQLVSQRTVGSILNLPVVKETTNTAGQVVRQVRDTGGALIEYTLDKATNKISAVRLLSALAR